MHLPIEHHDDAQAHVEVFARRHDSEAIGGAAHAADLMARAAANDALTQVANTGRVFDTLWLKLDIVTGAYVVPNLATDAPLMPARESGHPDSWVPAFAGTSG